VAVCGLFREIAKLGYRCGELAVQRYLRRFRDGRGHAALPGPKPPTGREVTRWVMTHLDRLGAEEADRLRRIRDADPGLDRLTIQVRGWATMTTELRDQDLERWIVAVEQDTLAPLASFARNLRRPLRACISASNGFVPVEGANRPPAHVRARDELATFAHQVARTFARGHDNVGLESLGVPQDRRTETVQEFGRGLNAAPQTVSNPAGNTALRFTCDECVAWAEDVVDDVHRPGRGAGHVRMDGSDIRDKRCLLNWRQLLSVVSS
jgi:hypothetical protein